MTRAAASRTASVSMGSSLRRLADEALREVSAPFSKVDRPLRVGTQGPRAYRLPALVELRGGQAVGDFAALHPVRDRGEPVHGVGAGAPSQCSTPGSRNIRK